MESFSLAAEHAGAIQHTHLIRLDPSAVAAARELRIAITVIVAGWVAIAGLRTYFGRTKGSPHRQPRFKYPLPTDVGGIHPERPTHQTSQPPEPPISTTTRHHRQRRISRGQHGLRVSRRLPTRTSRGSLPAADDQSPSSPQSPYWGKLPSPSKSSGKSRPDNRNRDIPLGGSIDTGPATSKRIPKTGRRPRGADLVDTRRHGRKTPNREKRFGVADPLAWDIINRSLTQQRRLSSLVGTDDPLTVPVSQTSNKTTDVASRTSSQRRALNRFARELEKYADAAGATGNVPVITPTISESKASVHTVKPLVPYKDEFRAAGLAVTSAEQSQSLADKSHIQPAFRRDRPHKHSNGRLQARKKLDTLGDGASSRTSPSVSCTSSGSYVEFSPPGGHMFHAIESLVPRKANTKSKNCQNTRKRLLSWFLKKQTSKDKSVTGHGVPVQIQQAKGGQIKPNDSSFAHGERHRLPHRNHRPTMQSIPEIQLWPRPVPPAKYVTPKKEACVTLTSNYYDHPAQEDRHHRNAIDAKQSLGLIGMQGKRDITRGVLPKPLPEPISTIEEETEINTLMDNSIPDGGSPPTGQKEITMIPAGSRRGPNAVSSATHESSIPSLPFAARLAASTVSSLQRALDDACQKIDAPDQQAGDLLVKKAIKPELPPIPRRDSRHNASHHPLPRKPRSTERFIFVNRNMPTVETLQSISKPLPPEPVSATQATPEKRPDTKPSQPVHQAPPVPAPRPLTGKRKNAVAELAKAEEMLRDLDVFLNDYDDADIEDRDVIKGLQVAIHAAADDLYDGYIRHKTGLRIRRFLADLKSFEDVTELGPSEQRAREKRAEIRRREGTRDENNRR
ncbi:hypothetical protein F5Y03DRAFT_408916 [Xylaria venustula]|nr:hypothetical protein F5Y03DRAFT_408916 [Xylaria venustula]